MILYWSFLEDFWTDGDGLWHSAGDQVGTPVIREGLKDLYSLEWWWSIESEMSLAEISFHYQPVLRGVKDWVSEDAYNGSIRKFDLVLQQSHCLEQWLCHSLSDLVESCRHVTWYIGCTGGRKYRELHIGLDTLGWTYWAGHIGLDTLGWTHWVGHIGLDCYRWAGLLPFRSAMKPRSSIAMYTDESDCYVVSLTGMTDSATISPASWGRIIPCKIWNKRV